ncbi:RHS repeat-associated core domain-containing protein [Agromyces silvae]|uniref:RHS repeat-associated core domain-containing protein n=1 Tax=Agromyces silvae TaxID=3388266 RepID=UPI00280BC169|nr:RHS repeat-associated core domain-containing protein [Agromyces protaetiae]
MTGGLVSPVWAASAPGDTAGDVQLGSFSLADGLEGTIGELDGSFGFSLPAGGVQLAWDSRALGVEPAPLGRGWSFGVSKIRVTGGVWVHPASGGAFEMDASAPTGLAGYPRNDVSFAAAAAGAVVPARADGSVGETPYAYVLHELGGVATYYDAAGYPVRETSGDLVTTTDYDVFGNATATIDADGNRTAYAYDEAGALVAATQADRDGAPVGGMRYGYDDYGRVNSLERENGVRTDYTFTSAAQISTEVTTAPDGVLSEREYTYAPAGTLSSRIDRVRGDDGRLHVTRTEYEYDALDRLVRSNIREGDGADSRVLTRTEYEPTIGGDLAAETVTTHPDTAEAVSTTREFEYSAVGELTAIVADGQRRAQEFDVEGNLLASADGDRYEYDAADRLLAHTTPDGVRIETTYWADGARKEHTTSTGATRYYWDGVRLINEVHETPAASQGTASYLIGTTRHARTTRADGEAASTSYFGTDRHGNVTDLTDEAGARTTTYTYSDYGVATVTGDRSGRMPAGIGELAYNPFQYAAEYTYRDGTQPLGPRTYDPQQARFLTEDDAPLANLYAFGDLNPITNVDPSGREAIDDWVNVGLAIAGFVFTAAGAALMLSNPSTLFTVMGGIGAFVAGLDFAAAGAELFIALSGPRFLAPEVTMIAAWVVFATGLGILGGGGAVKYFTRSKKVASATGSGAPEQVAQTETKATPVVTEQRPRSKPDADDDSRKSDDGDSNADDGDDPTSSESGGEYPIIVVENDGWSPVLSRVTPTNRERTVDEAFTPEQQRNLVNAYKSVAKLDTSVLDRLFRTSNSELKDLLLSADFHITKAKSSAKTLVTGLETTPPMMDMKTTDLFLDSLKSAQGKLEGAESLMKTHSIPGIEVVTNLRTQTDKIGDDLRNAF